MTTDYGHFKDYSATKDYDNSNTKNVKILIVYKMIIVMNRYVSYTDTAEISPIIKQYYLLICNSINHCDTLTDSDISNFHYVLRHAVILVYS